MRTIPQRKAPRGLRQLSSGCKLDGPAWSLAKTGLSKWVALGYLEIGTEWPQKPPCERQGAGARRRLLGTSGETRGAQVSAATGLLSSRLRAVPLGPPAQKLCGAGGRGKTVPCHESTTLLCPSSLLPRLEMERPAAGGCGLPKFSHQEELKFTTLLQGCAVLTPRPLKPQAHSPPGQTPAPAHHRGPAPSAAGSRAGWRPRAVCLGAGSSV